MASWGGLVMMSGLVLFPVPGQAMQLGVTCTGVALRARLCGLVVVLNGVSLHDRDLGHTGGPLEQPRCKLQHAALLALALELVPLMNRPPQLPRVFWPRGLHSPSPVFEPPTPRIFSVGIYLYYPCPGI